MGERSQFQGVIGRTRADSTPWWPPEPRPPAGAPNVLVVVLDDVGFAQLGCYGSDIETPTLDGLAAGGLQYTNFHTTALCSPTRACVLTGRNHHTAGMGRVIDLATGFPGYDAYLPPSCGTLPEILTPHGYAAYAVGKWHLTPEHEHHLGASRRRWPLGKGFERWYGYFDGETSQFGPTLLSDNHCVPPPADHHDGYHLTEDLVDHGLAFLGDLRAVEPDKPWFLYLCPGACHSPHQSPPEWRERYRGRFDQGWDAWRQATFERQLAEGILPEGTELSPRPDWVPAWDDLSDDQRRVSARYMECFAAYLSHFDHHLGRLLDRLRETGELDDTLVMVISDNGASSEGGPNGSVNDARNWNVAEMTVEEAAERIDEIGGPTIHNNYPWGWTVAGNTPFKRWKRETHEGGVCDPLIVHWPAGIAARGERRRQYAHAIDLLPTILEAIGIEPPAVIDGVEQQPIAGIALNHTFDDGTAPDRHTVQYYEMFGCRALYQDGWKAVTHHPIADTSIDFDDDPWELYHVAVDPSECHDLAAEEPERLQALIDRWWEEAERYQVLPLDTDIITAILGTERPGIPERAHYEFRPGGGPVPETCTVNVRNRSHTVTAELSGPLGEAEGVLLVQGSVLGGWVLYVADGHLHYAHNYVGLRTQRARSDAPLDPGTRTLALRFERTAEHRGVAHLLADGVEVGAGEIPQFTPVRFAITGDGIHCGEHWGVPVCDDYRAPFRFTGPLHRVLVDVEGAAFSDPEADAHDALRKQ